MRGIYEQVKDDINKNGVNPFDFTRFNAKFTGKQNEKKYVRLGRFQRCIKRLLVMTRKYKNICRSIDDMVVGSMVVELTGNTFGAALQDQTPEQLWLSTVIEELDLSKLITNFMLDMMEQRLVFTMDSMLL